MTLSPEDAIDVINDRFGSHPHMRALHAKGVFLSGTFTANSEAATLSSAAHLTGDPVPVLARASNGGGDPGIPDYAPEVRGLAVSFRPEGGDPTDLVSQSVPKFPVKTPEEFIEFVRLSGRDAKSALGLLGFMATRPNALLGFPANALALRPPESYATCRYFGVHAFKWIAADGSSRFVRTTWAPEAGDHRLSPGAAKSRGRDFLVDEIRERLAAGVARFDLEVQIAEPGDKTGDPSHQWPSSRRRVVVGTLELDAVAEDPESEANGGGLVVFDPMRLTDGIEASDDPVLLFRPGAYSASASRRAG